MIISIPNPPMGPEDVKRFREIVSGKCTEEERQRRIAEMKEMKRVGEEVIRNHGGKDPILGYEYNV